MFLNVYVSICWLSYRVKMEGVVLVHVDVGVVVVGGGGGEEEEDARREKRGIGGN